MANPKTKTVEFTIDSFLFLFNFVNKIIVDSNKNIKRYFERLEIAASNPDEDFNIYNYEIEEFEESKNNIIKLSPIYEMLLGIYDFSALHVYYDISKEIELKKKIELMDTAKKLVDVLKDSVDENQGV